MSRITAGERIASKRKAKRRQKITRSELMGILSELLSTLKKNMSVWSKQLQHLWQRLPSRHRAGLVVVSAVLVILLLLPLGENEPESGPDLQTVVDTSSERQPVAMDNTGLSESTQTDEVRVTESDTKENVLSENVAVDRPDISHKVKDGDTLSSIFRRHSLSLPDLYAMIKVEGKGKALSRIQPGQKLLLSTNNEGQVSLMRVTRGTDESVTFVRQPDGSFRRR
ncbi:LysM peptidoglycan-binding domain-containing protein [Veronia pacifica]|uniref:LysM domain-containing protein n=1 Tax=Veronia pacifica TaxID=1080227 RepID=A0A1C3EQ35_9GAMM|nr:LysM-like peptidoglycan-binding domain-containing protein [Veronia pacifica]ODA35299.1 hypothetical protein A8L45_03770 [Veronia pacifica]